VGFRDSARFVDRLRFLELDALRVFAIPPFPSRRMPGGSLPRMVFTFFSGGCEHRERTQCKSTGLTRQLTTTSSRLIISKSRRRELHRNVGETCVRLSGHPVSRHLAGNFVSGALVSGLVSVFARASGDGTEGGSWCDSAPYAPTGKEVPVICTCNTHSFLDRRIIIYMPEVPFDIPIDRKPDPLTTRTTLGPDSDTRLRYDFRLSRTTPCIMGRST
jgi:hypothetical protein